MSASVNFRQSVSFNLETDYSNKFFAIDQNTGVVVDAAKSTAKVLLYSARNQRSPMVQYLFDAAKSTAFRDTTTLRYPFIFLPVSCFSLTFTESLRYVAFRLSILQSFNFL